LVGSCYHPPGQSADEIEVFLAGLQTSLDKVFHINPESFFTLGDLNDPCTAWVSDPRNSELKLKLYDLIDENDLYQIVVDPTNIASTTADVLDLIIDSPRYINNRTHLLLTGSHHQVIRI
jgi:hypothetical protein